MIDTKTVRDRLVDDFDYPEANVDMVVEKINAMSPDVYAAFEEWFNTGAIADVEVEGFNYASVKEKRAKMNPIAVYLTLDWLTREPVRAKASLARMQTPFGGFK